MTFNSILIIGATGAIGKYMVNASVEQGHPTFALVRSTSPSDPAKAEQLRSFQNAGMPLLLGDLTDHSSLVAAYRKVENVILPVGQILDQLKVLNAAKEAGMIKHFIPSEYGNQLNRMDLDVPITRAIFGPKLTVQCAIEASGILYTFVAAYCFFSYFLASFGQNNLLTI